MAEWYPYHVFEREGKHLCIDKIYLGSFEDALLEIDEHKKDGIKDGSIKVYFDEDGEVELERLRDATPEEIEKYETEKSEQAKRAAEYISSGISRPCSG